jgi:hypothetical protein
MIIPQLLVDGPLNKVSLPGAPFTLLECRCGARCCYKHLFCPFRHPLLHLSCPAPCAVQPARVGKSVSHPGLSFASVPTAGPFWAIRMVEDNRVLPIPEPYDKIWLQGWDWHREAAHVESSDFCFAPSCARLLTRAPVGPWMR